MDFPITVYSDNQELVIGSARELSLQFADYQKIDAAGGIVHNVQGEILMMLRRGYWDFPKGKIDDGETPREAAVREVCEETGVASLQIESDLPSTFHTYQEKGKFILKETHWFRMQSEQPEKLQPQIEEDITELQWVKKEEVAERLSDSFASLRNVWGNYLSTYSE